MAIDLNADVGEGYGTWRLGDDAALLAVVSSANIACGFHAGDPGLMRQTVALAKHHGVAIGAHPSLPDLQGFGRRELRVTPEEAYELVLYQTGALLGFTRAAGVPLVHVKPHGALYNMAARDPALARGIAEAVHDLDPQLILVGLAGSALIRAGEQRGLRVAAEAFVDRRYTDDGHLLSRHAPEAVIQDIEEAVAQALCIVQAGEVLSVNGQRVALRADTLCLHGDTPQAVAFTRAVRAALEREGVVIQALTGNPRR